MPDLVEIRVKELSYFSEGFFKRIMISLEAALNQGEINHITGDIHFIAIFLKKRKTILTIHDVGFMSNRNYFVRVLLKLFWITLPVYRSAIITTVSTATKLELLKYVGVNPARIRVVYVPIDPHFSASVKEFDKTLPRILQIGTKPNKNLPRLFESLKGISCKLIIVGIMDADLIRLLKISQLNYEIFSNLTNAEMIDQYRAADIVSFVSTYEGFGMPIVEANATGRVIVTSNILSMPEIAGDAAHLVDPFDNKSIRDGFLKVINDDVYREKLILNGFANQKRFEVAKIASDYFHIYNLMRGT
jgi:glycosyltransferase involved in cell wall biosynthesis